MRVAAVTGRGRSHGMSRTREMITRCASVMWTWLSRVSSDPARRSGPGSESWGKTPAPLQGLIGVVLSRRLPLRSLSNSLLSLTTLAAHPPPHPTTPHLTFDLVDKRPPQGTPREHISSGPGQGAGAGNEGGARRSRLLV